MDDGASPNPNGQIGQGKLRFWKFITALGKVIKPFAALSRNMAEKAKEQYGIDLFDGLDDVTEEEIISMVNEGHEQGVFLASEAQMIQNIFEFDDKEAKDIMVHRKNLITLSDDTLLKDAIVFAVEQNKSRIPIYHEELDNILGQVHIKDLLAYSMHQEVFDKPICQLDNLVKHIDFIPETRKINTLFREMQIHKRHMVIVVDEYGQTAGLIALEDILEEIVGNIEDEHDEEEQFITKMENGCYMISGMTPLEDINEALDIQIECEDIDTLNGYLISKIDKIPSEHELIVVRDFGYVFRVTEVENKVIKSVMVRKDVKSNLG